jgi:hypothetical protein
MATSGPGDQAAPSVAKWLIALLLGSSTVATLVTKTWDYFAKVQNPAHLELIKVATHWGGERSEFMTPHLVLRNTGDKTAVVTAVSMGDVVFGEFSTDRLIDRQRVQRKDPNLDPIYELQVVTAVPPSEFVSLFPPAPATTRVTVCAIYQAGKEQKRACGVWLPPEPKAR